MASSASAKLRFVLGGLVMVLLLVFAYQQGAAATRHEIAVLRQRLRSIAEAGRDARDERLHRGASEGEDDPSAGRRGREKEAEPGRRPTNTGRPTKKTKKPTTAPVAEEELPAHESAATDAAAVEAPASANEVADGGMPPPSAGGRSPHSDDAGAPFPVATMSQDPSHPAYIKHEYRDAEQQRWVVAAVDRQYPKWIMSATAKNSHADRDEVERHEWSRAVQRAVTRGWAATADGDGDATSVVPVMVIPLFHDGEEVRSLLTSIDAPVRLFVFAWNSDDGSIARIVDVLKRIPFGVVIHHFAENVGFSGAVNTGLRSGREFLPDPPAQWYFIVNADTEFPRGALGRFASAANGFASDGSHGLIYGPRQDHFAFVVTKAAVDRVGYFDEVFYPGYMEDIDFHWRVRAAGLDKKITGIQFRHRQSVNERKPRHVVGDYQGMLIRASRGWEYGWMKWGRYGTHDIERDRPPSGWTTPFNIPGAPLSLWTLDAGVRRCVRTSHGQYHIKSSTCWYNGTKLLAKLPPGTEISRNLLVPGPTGR